MTTLPYQICDVFTDRPLTGNPLAVFTDPAGIDAPTMQALAREMNLSESTFVLPPTVPDADVRIRIFTPQVELPFAGHPTLGTAFVLAASRPGDRIAIQTARGVVPVRLTRQGDRVVFGWMSQPLPTRRPFPDAGAVFAALGVAGSGVAGSPLPLEIHDNGPHYTYVEVDSVAALSALRPDLQRLAAFGTTAFGVYARAGDNWRARVFVPGAGVAEDPATGAAAGPFALHLASHGRIAFGQEIVIEQGIELGRPSRLHAIARGSAAQVAAIEVGGSAVVLGHGALTI